jgi:hypothetical protein
MKTISNAIVNLVDFINNILVPLVFAVAFIVFLYGVARYFIAGAANPEQRKNGTQIIIYSVIGFAVMMSIWGIVNLVKNSFGFDSNARPCLPTFGKDTNCGDVTATGSNTGGAPQNLLPNNYQNSPANEPINPDTGQPGIY